MASSRFAFGLAPLDEALGGGLLPGKLTVIAGATGIGKTQLGLRWSHQGLAAEGAPGIVFDLTTRGDDQNHIPYAAEQLGWNLERWHGDRWTGPASVWETASQAGRLFDGLPRDGRRVTRRDLDADQWHAWKTDLARLLRTAGGFLYTHLAHGTRRIVFDGIEPTHRMSDSIQIELLEYLYHNFIRKSDDWAARELFRELYREHLAQIEAHRYASEDVGCLVLYTTPHVLLDDMQRMPIDEGDLFSNANTIILMGRVLRDGRQDRGLVIAKHRGSYCLDETLAYRMTAEGPVFG